MNEVEKMLKLWIILTENSRPLKMSSLELQLNEEVKKHNEAEGSQEKAIQDFNIFSYLNTMSTKGIPVYEETIRNTTYYGAAWYMEDEEVVKRLKDKSYRCIM